MKVLIIGPGRKTKGGITSVIKEYEKSEIWENWNCRWIETYIDRNFLWKGYYFMFGLVKFLLNLSGAKIIHIHLSEPTSAFRKSIFLKIAILFRKPAIIHIHASAETTILSTRKGLYFKLFKKASAIVVLSKYWKPHIENIINQSFKIHVIYNPCPTISNAVNIKKQNIILFAGNINKRKGYQDLIRAFKIISERHEKWKLVFAGNGEIEDGKSLAKELRIARQVVFKGWVTGKEKEELFRKASLFCLPSYVEGLPMAVLDAWAYGLPVITTPVGGLPDVLLHGGNAMVFEPGDIIMLAKHIDALILNIDLRRKLSEASLRLSNEQFNVRSITHQLSELYRSLL